MSPDMGRDSPTGATERNQDDMGTIRITDSSL